MNNIEYHYYHDTIRHPSSTLVADTNNNIFVYAVNRMPLAE